MKLLVPWKVSIPLRYATIAPPALFAVLHMKLLVPLKVTITLSTVVIAPPYSAEL